MPESHNPGIDVVVAGGTLACGEVPSRKADGTMGVKKDPIRGKVRSIVENDVDPETRVKGEPYTFHELPTLRDSSQYKPQHLESITGVVCSRLERFKKSMIIVMGTDNAPGLMHVLAERVPASLLGDRAIMGIVSQKHAFPNRPDDHTGKFYADWCEPVSNLTNAIHLLATYAQFRGRIAVCCKGAVYSARGFRKLDTKTDDPFYSRFHQWFEADMRNPVPKWRFNPDFETAFHHTPRGEDNPDFSIVDGIETLPLRLMSNYKNLLDWMKLLANPTKRNPQTLNGIVLTAPGQAQIREADRAILSEAINDAGKKGIPVVLVPDAVESEVETWDAPPDEGDKMYAGSPELAKNAALGGPQGRIIHGGEMLPEEATYVLGMAVAHARNKGLKEGYMAEIANYVRQYLHFMETGQSLGGPQ